MVLGPCILCLHIGIWGSLLWLTPATSCILHLSNGPCHLFAWPCGPLILGEHQGRDSPKSSSPNSTLCHPRHCEKSPHKAARLPASRLCLGSHGFSFWQKYTPLKGSGALISKPPAAARQETINTEPSEDHEYIKRSANDAWCQTSPCELVSLDALRGSAVAPSCNRAQRDLPEVASQP